VQGAFTGAVRDRAGRVEAAEGGTLSRRSGRDPAAMQAKAPRFLQDKQLSERVGETRTRMADVRIVAATNATSMPP